MSGRVSVAMALAAAVLLAGCVRWASTDPIPVQDPARTTTAVTEAPTTASTTLTPEQEVERAYLASWDAHARAARTLDPTGLEEWYADHALDAVLSEIEEPPGKQQSGNGFRRAQLRDPLPLDTHRARL